MSTYTVPTAAQQPITILHELTYGGEVLSAGSGLPVNIVAGSSAGTQYTDGGTPPTTPVGGALVFDNSGAWADVGVDHPLPVSASVSLTINSEFTPGTTAPSKTSLVGGKSNDGTPQYQPLPLGASGRSIIIEGYTGGTGVPVTGTFWQATQPVSGTVTVTQGTPTNWAVNIASLNGTTISTNAGTADAGTQRMTLASDQKVPTKAASGDFADGSNTTFGAKADARSTATDTTAITAMQVLKQLSYMLQNPAALVAGAALIGGVEVYDSGGSNKLAIDSSGRLTLIPNSSINNVQVNGTTIDTNSGTKSAGTQRIVLATDQPALTNAQPANITQVAGNAIATGNNAVPTLNSAAAGAIAAYGSNAATLTANTDYAFKWGAGGTTQVNHVMIQNNSSVNINVEVDAATNAGSQLLSNTLGQNTLYLDIQMTALHVQGNATPNVNGSSASNIVIRGWL